MLCLKPGMTVLNIGSGIGDIAVELVRYENVTVVGVDSSYAKVQYATNRVSEARLSHKITFVHARLDELSSRLAGRSFDVIYAMESLKVAVSFDLIYRDLFKLLKPGGKLGIVEWCWTSAFNPMDSDHCRLSEIIEASSQLPVRGPRGRTIHTARSALERAGMQVTHCEDLGSRVDKIPWYAPLERALSDPNVPWSEDSGVLCPAFGGISKNTGCLIVQAAKWQLFTPLALFVAQRPA